MLKKKNSRVDTIVGTTSTVKGEVVVNGLVRVDGSIEGRLEAETVIIGQDGKVKGDIKARNIVVGGLVEGNLYADESVEVESKGKIVGDIRTRKLTIVEGGIFEGQSIMHKEEGEKVVEMNRP